MTLGCAEFTTLLSKLRIGLGFMFSPDDRARPTQSPPTEVDASTDAVFVAEGLDPLGVDRNLHRRVRAEVREAFQRHQDQQIGPRLPKNR